jgi:hypothetical protein
VQSKVGGVIVPLCLKMEALKAKYWDRRRNLLSMVWGVIISLGLKMKALKAKYWDRLGALLSMVMIFPFICAYVP